MADTVASVAAAIVMAAAQQADSLGVTGAQIHMTVLTIGDTSRDGLLEITDTRWDSNGTMFVTVRELIGTNCWVGGLPIERMRSLARRAIHHPEKTRSSRVVRQWSHGGCDHVTFAVSRLARLT